MEHTGSVVDAERGSAKAPLSAPLRILHLEDNRHDAELVQAMLAEEGIPCAIVCVETQSDFESALEQGRFDLIFSDFSLPSFNGISALTIAKKKCPGVPYIFISGTVGEETAVAILQAGATDYVLKEHLTRLPAVVRRALREAEERTERKQAEETLQKTSEQLRQSQKMEAVGQLAGGIAHDFNNILMVINGYSDLALKAIPPNSPLRDSLEQVRQAGERATTLTRQLLAFSRRQVLQLKVLDLNAVVTNLEKMLQRLIGEDVRFETRLSQRLGRVKADPGQIEQVVMNLVVNARDAMPQGGRLMIETADVELDESYARGHAVVQPGPYVLLAVSDTGCGMDKETQARVFEPFFTTKGKDKGTGLGLATAYGIVKQSGGYIWVYSEPGQGATFKIYLPRVEKEAEPLEPHVGPPALRKGSETILLVEDDEKVRNLLRTILAGNGYTVLEASNGIAALEKYEHHQEGIQLLLTDAVMPEMSGRELAGRLIARNLDLKVLFCSGYTDDAIVRHGILEEGIPFLQKPFTPNTLLRKVREVLDAHNDCNRR